MLKQTKIAFIPVKGIISFEEGVSFSLLSRGNVCCSDKILDMLEEAKKSKAIKAVILEINSPGGTPYPAKEIAEHVKNLGKPTVAWIREVAASGAYWIASACEKIVGDALSTVGSIGVTSFRPDFTKLMKNFGIDVKTLSTGIYKNLGSPFQKSTPEEKRIMEKELQTVYKIFIEEVKKNRNLSENVVKEISSGKVYLGDEGINLGLLDYLGGKEKALAVAKELAKIQTYKLVDFGKKKRRRKNLLERLIESYA